MRRFIESGLPSCTLLANSTLIQFELDCEITWRYNNTTNRTTIRPIRHIIIIMKTYDLSVIFHTNCYNFEDFYFGYRAEDIKCENQEEKKRKKNFMWNFRNLNWPYLIELTCAKWLIWYDLLIWPDQLIGSG